MKGKDRKTCQIWVVILCVAFLVACGTDKKDDAKNIELDVEQSDAGDSDASDADAEDEDPYNKVEGDVTTREPCDAVCAAEGLVCDDSVEHPLLGTGGMEDQYGESGFDAFYGKGNCDEAPEEFKYDPSIDLDVELHWYACWCTEAS